MKTRQRPRVRKPIIDEVHDSTILHYRQSNGVLLQPPVPPVPLCLHLGVTAQTHSIPDYCRVFSDFDTFYIDHQSIVAASAAPLGDHMMTQQEMDITTDILGQMIK